MKRHLDNFSLRTWLIMALSLCLTPTILLAHPLPGDATGFTSGILHPFHGLDHLLAMLAVGLWAAQLGGRSTWALPLGFVGVMILGGIVGASGMPIPFVETGILVSVLMLGLFIATAARVPLTASLILVGIFALFHGHAHGTEMPANASGILYGVGFVVATVLFHSAGIALALAAQRLAQTSALRYAGAAIVIAGLAIWVGV